MIESGKRNWSHIFRVFRGYFEMNSIVESSLFLFDLQMHLANTVSKHFDILVNMRILLNQHLSKTDHCLKNPSHSFVSNYPICTCDKIFCNDWPIDYVQSWSSNKIYLNFLFIFNQTLYIFKDLHWALLETTVIVKK